MIKGMSEPASGVPGGGLCVGGGFWLWVWSRGWFRGEAKPGPHGLRANQANSAAPACGTPQAQPAESGFRATPQPQRAELRKPSVRSPGSEQLRSPRVRNSASPACGVRVPSNSAAPACGTPQPQPAESGPGALHKLLPTRTQHSPPSPPYPPRDSVTATDVPLPSSLFTSISPPALVT